jgi:hypothetical protein
MTLMALSGCPASDDGGDNDDLGGEPATTGADDDGATTGEDPTDGATTGEDPTDGATTGEGGIPWSDVPCGETTCVDGEVCVTGNLGCNYDPCDRGGEAEWIEPDPRCEPLPEGCDPADPLGCLEEAYCDAPEFNDFDAGALECAASAEDCFCT